MSDPGSARRIAKLDSLVANLPARDRDGFGRIYHLDVTRSETAPPSGMHPWLVQQFGSVDAVRQQCIVKVTNRVTLEGALKP